MNQLNRIFRISEISANLYSMDFRWKVHILLLSCLLTRLCFVGKYLDSCDSIDFALGLREYDLSLMQPHFPGYPVYIFISWLFFKLFHHEVWALVVPSVIFGSLTVYPLSLLAREMFSERVAILTVVLYILNPLCWLQAERPTSDAMGLFFVMLSAYFLHRVFNGKILLTPSHKLRVVVEAASMPRGVFKKYGWFSRRNCLFFGSLTISFGLGVRLSYFPFISLWISALSFLIIQRKHSETNTILYGLMGFVFGFCLWLFPQIGYVGSNSFWQSGLSFSHGHFTDWGGSVITFSGLKRIVSLTKSLVVHGLGGWWDTYSLLRLIPLSIMVISLLYSLLQYQFESRGKFLMVYIIPYMIWLALGQNVSNPRHIMPIIPVILLLIAYGLCKVYEEGNKRISMLLILIFIGSMSVISFKLVIRYHNNVPAPIQLIQFIERHFDDISTRIYCSNDKRFFDFYAPQWDVRNVRDVEELKIDLQSSLCKPQNILFVQTLGEIEQSGVRGLPIIMSDGNSYTDDTKAKLLLYKWNSL